MVNEAGGNIAQPVTVIAKTGWSTDELMQGIETADRRATWDLVSLLIGVNNQYRGRSLENFGAEFRRLAETAIDLSHDGARRVQALSIPDWGQTPFGKSCGRDQAQISLEIDAFNDQRQGGV